METKIKPAMPLWVAQNEKDWAIGHGDVEVANCQSGELARMLAKRANAYPRLVEALRVFARQACDDSGVLDSHPVEDCSELTEGELRHARALLRELGEQT